ncbi:MAG: 50S ribosomal protein L32 [Patescibacteria group bacterium]
MGLPSKRRTKTSKKERAAHFALKKMTLNACGKCGQPVMPHRACNKCGTYKGRTVLEIKSKAKTLRQKEQERKANAKAKVKK